MMRLRSKPPKDDLPSELKVLLDAAKVIPPVPAAVRARAMKGARAALAHAIEQAEPRAASRGIGPRFALAIGVAALSVVTMGAAAALTFGPAIAWMDHDEIILLGRASESVAAHRFSDALRPLDEHRRRFENSQFAEEREALRVQALAGLERGADVQRSPDAVAAGRSGSARGR